MKARATAGSLCVLLALFLASGCDTTGLIYGPACSGHGVENPAGSGEECSCFEGYSGSWCDNCDLGFQDNDSNGTCSPSCDALSLTCGVRQYCDDSDGSAECVCETGYDGPDCNDCAGDYQDNDGDDLCEPSCAHSELACNDHGSCSDASGKVSCQCDSGYQGTNCDECAQNLQDNDQDGNCEPSCSSDSVDCGHGSCDDSSGSIACACEAAYQGQFCDECSSGHQDNDQNGSCLPTCATAGYDCSGEGACVDTSGTAECDCNDGFHHDGAGNCISAAFIVTLVNDNLDPTDGEMMKSGLLGLGYFEETWDRDVSSNELIGYLESNVTMLYHTGHGSDGSVMTSSGSINAGSATINVGNTIFATCLTLSDTGWKNAFGPTAQNVMGYTKVSYDGPDDDVVDTYVDELGAGRTHLQAWYLSNASVGMLSDRWAAYSREGATIVEYSARTGNNPSTQMAGEWIAVEEASRVRVAPALMTAQNDSPARFARVAIQMMPAPSSHVEPGEINDWLQPTQHSDADAARLAGRYLAVQGLLPADAVLDDVIAIESVPADHHGPAAVVGHTVRFGRVVGNLPVRGMGIADHISVLVASGRVVAHTSYWPVIEVQAQAAAQRRNLLDLGEAITRAAPAIEEIVKSSAPIDIVRATPVYGTLGARSSARELIPAYELRSTNGDTFIVDATTGNLLL